MRAEPLYSASARLQIICAVLKSLSGHPGFRRFRQVSSFSARETGPRGPRRSPALSPSQVSGFGMGDLGLTCLGLRFGSSPGLGFESSEIRRPRRLAPRPSGQPPDQLRVFCRSWASGSGDDGFGGEGVLGPGVLSIQPLLSPGTWARFTISACEILVWPALEVLVGSRYC